MWIAVVFEKMPTMKLLRLVQKPGLQKAGFSRTSDIWALDTPVSRASLEKLAVLGNTKFGRGTHWIEEQEVNPLTGVIEEPGTLP